MTFPWVRTQVEVILTKGDALFVVDPQDDIRNAGEDDVVLLIAGLTPDGSASADPCGRGEESPFGAVRLRLQLARRVRGLALQHGVWFSPVIRVCAGGSR